MPKSNSGLNDTFLRNLKSQEQTKFSDGGGLFIHLSPNGTKLWRMADTSFQALELISGP